MTLLEVKRRVAANIKRCRAKAGLTQEALAKKLKVSPRYVAMLEQSPRNLSLESLYKITVSVRDSWGAPNRGCVM